MAVNDRSVLSSIVDVSSRFGANPTFGSRRRDSRTAMPPRSSFGPLLGLSGLLFGLVIAAWSYRSAYLPELDVLVNDLALRWNLVPTG